MSNRLPESLNRLVRWCGQIVVWSLFAAVLLTPVGVASVWLVLDSPSNTLIQLNTWPLQEWAWLVYAAACIAILILLFLVLGLVYPQDLPAPAFWSMVLSVPLCIVGASTIGPMLTNLSAKHMAGPLDRNALVMASYSTTTSYKGVRTKHYWVDLSHPLKPDQVLTLREYKVPRELRTPGRPICMTVYTGLLGDSWSTQLRACTANKNAQPLSGTALRLLQPELHDHEHEANVGTSADGLFDSSGRAWWLTSTSYGLTLLPAGKDVTWTRSIECGRSGKSRLSTDRRSIVAFWNRSAVGTPDPLPIPHWEKLGRNITLMTLEGDELCRTHATLLQPGWVLDADFDHSSQQLAVLWAQRTDASTDLAYGVTIYKISADGSTQVTSEHALRDNPHWRPFPKAARLQWRPPGLVVLHDKHHRPTWEILPLATSIPGNEAVHGYPELPPMAGGLRHGWYLAAKAREAPVSVYRHDAYAGALLLHREQARWYHLSPVLLPPWHQTEGADPATPASADLFNLSNARMSLSPDGRRLIACGARYVFANSRCVLLGLPWPSQ